MVELQYGMLEEPSVSLCVEAVAPQTSAENGLYCFL